MASFVFEFKKPPDFKFFFKLTDKNGILQHSRFSAPIQVTGYSLDDNARALVVAGWAWSLYRDQRFKRLIDKFLQFFEGQQINGDFRNYLFISHGQRFLSREKAEDSFGQALWALGFILSLDLVTDIKNQARQIFEKLFEKTGHFGGLRTKAYCLLGLSYYLKVFRHSLVQDLALKLANDLVEAFAENKESDWLWFEPILTYANAVLPWSLFFASSILEDRSFLKVASETFDFLIKKTMIKGLPVPIGQRGWYPKGGSRALFDQQPIEAGYMVLGSLAAHQATKRQRYAQLARDWFGWFHGRNLPGLSLIDKRDGGCYDGLEAWKVNLNKGAESTICYLLAYLALSENEKKSL